MSDHENPFAEPEEVRPPGGASAAATKSALAGWIAAGVLLLAAIAGFMLWAETRNRQQRELSTLRDGLTETSAKLAATLAERQTNLDQIALLKDQMASLERDKETNALAARSLENEMRASLESKDVAISQLQGKLTVNILDRIMFDSGEAVLKPDGAAVLQKIAALLAAHPELKIHVVGHTDNVPVRQRFASNWELSTARALAAVHFLTEKAGLDPRRVGAVGYGEFRPIADNATPEGRAKNRRIAIVILPDELVGADAPSVAATNAPPVSPRGSP